MKPLFGCLMCLIFTTAETFALKGGPPYPGGGTNIVGRYGGVLRPPFCPLPDPAGCGTGFNSIGIFSVVVPEAGIGSGTALLFVNGRSFTGTITASGNPNTAVISAVLDTRFTYNAPCGTINSFSSVTATASGRLTANVVPPRQALTAVYSILLRGAADIATRDVGPDCRYPESPPPTVRFQVDGFKQSNSAQ